jgi:hypothetical protein
LRADHPGNRVKIARRSTHREIGGLIAERRTEALANLKAQIEALGFSPQEVVGKGKRGRPRKVEA